MSMDRADGTIAKAPGPGKTMITAMATVTLTDMTRTATTTATTTTIMGIIMTTRPAVKPRRRPA